MRSMPNVLAVCWKEPVSMPALYRGLVRIAKPQSTADAAGLKARLARMPVSERKHALTEVLREELAQVFGLSSGRDVDPTQSLQEMGADSLMAVEFRNRLVALADMQVPATIAFDYPTAEALSGYLLEEFELGDEVTEQEEAPTLSAGMDEPIAIISMACRLPGGVDSPSRFGSFFTRPRCHCSHSTLSIRPGTGL